MPAKADLSRSDAARTAWARRDALLLVGALVAGFLIRVLLLPAEGVPGDIGQFVVWVNHIAANGLGRAYDEDLTFGPVMAYLWAALGLIEPAFRSATDSSDPALRSLMKIPASVADFALAGVIAFAFRTRPRWAALGAGAVLLHPAVWYVSAWWGQYEPIYVLAVLAGTLLAVRDRTDLAAIAVAIAVMTKPQALPFMLPFAAWFLARGGLIGLARAGAIGAATSLLLWLPFIPAGGPQNYLTNLAHYQDDIFSILSVRAWNIWWLLQEVGANGEMASDRVSLIGPITFRVIGYALTGLAGLAVALRIVRDPTPRTFLVGLIATSLAAFSFLTTMHERYAYGVVILLLLLVPEQRMRLVSLAFGIVFTLNLLAAIPATETIATWLPISGFFGVTGSIAMTAITLFMLREAFRASAGTTGAATTAG